MLFVLWSQGNPETFDRLIKMSVFVACLPGHAMFSLWGSEQPYRSTNITLQSEGMEPTTETAAETATPEIVPDDKPTVAGTTSTIHIAPFCYHYSIMLS